MTESEIQRDILVYLKGVHHVHVWRSNAGQVHKNVKMAPKGCPDIIGYTTSVAGHDGPEPPWRWETGAFIGFEVKQPGKLQNPDQQDWEADMTSAGALYFVVHSVEETREIIERLFG
jgi:hypothetical protein